MASAIHFDGGSFKDPGGRVFRHENRVFRTLTPEAWPEMEAFLASDLYANFLADGQVVRTDIVQSAAVGLDPAAVGDRVLEHERVDYVSYPYEWSFDMLKDAALLTLDLQLRALQAGLTLKDATPFNVLFQAGRPVFIDLPSFESYQPGSPWAAFTQFCESFLYPLMVDAYRSIPFQPLMRAYLGRIPMAVAARMFTGRDALRPAVVKYVKLPARFQSSFGNDATKVGESVGKIEFKTEMVRATVQGLRGAVEGLTTQAGESVWADYTATCSYSDADTEGKRDFVRGALSASTPTTVWDLGCNTGEYSDLCVEAGATVVAIDGDPACINALYRAQQRGERSKAIQPLVGDLANPSPALGWGLRERMDYAARGDADFVLALALVHHLVIGANVPVDEVVRFLRSVAPAGVMEFVAKDDVQVKRLLATREDVFPDYTLGYFTTALEAEFSIQARRELNEGTRTIFHLGPR